MVMVKYDGEWDRERAVEGEGLGVAYMLNFRLLQSLETFAK